MIYCIKLRTVLNTQILTLQLSCSGSTARGDYQDESDIDILILLSQDKITWADEKRINTPFTILNLILEN